MAQKTVVIKKYENRRLYDTTNSRYVNLEEVAQFLQQGNDVQVVDASSGEDITRLILTQIIVEDAKTPESSFPLDLLRQMVVASGRASQESALQYMKTMLELYQNAYRAMPNPLIPFDFTQNVRTGTDEKPDRGKRSTSPGKPPPTRQPNVKQPEPEDVAGLKSRLAELEKLVSKLAPPKTKRKRK
ncbi:MAG: polyhydroxyalkanoate synthesis regulator DNA-binding domain-containing protein [Terracidiphilus sp.]